MQTTSADKAKLSGLRVLVVEDSFHIALMIETALEAEGAVIIGPAASLDQAFGLVSEGSPDLAVVDLILGDQETLPLIRKLAADGVKAVLATGNDVSAELRRELPDLPVLEKPYTSGQLIDLIHSIL